MASPENYAEGERLPEPVPAGMVQKVGKYFLQELTDPKNQVGGSIIVLNRYAAEDDAECLEKLERGHLKFLDTLTTWSRAGHAYVVPLGNGYNIITTPVEEEPEEIPEDTQTESPITGALASHFGEAIMHVINSRLSEYGWAELLHSNPDTPNVQEAITNIIHMRHTLAAEVENFYGANEIIAREDTIHVIIYNKEQRTDEDPSATTQ